MQLTLYFAPFSCAFVPYVLLSEAGVTFDARPINIRGKENMTPEYLSLNPKHKVPLLLVDGQPLSENVAIQLWIAGQFPNAALMPSDPWDLAQATSLCAWFASGVHPHISRYNSPLKFCDEPGSQDATKKIAGRELMKQFELADRLLSGRSFFFDRWCAADIYLHWCFRRSGYFDLDLSAFENIIQHQSRLDELSSVKRAIAFDDECKVLFGL